MTDHEHFDITGIETKMRADLALARAEGIELVRTGQVEAPFIEAMRAFDEARVQFTLAGIRLQNSGVDRNIMLAAAGQALGSMWANALEASLGARERAILNGWVANMLAQAIGKDAAAKTIESVFRPAPSGTG